jgi:hypothetical protein
VASLYSRQQVLGRVRRSPRAAATNPGRGHGQVCQQARPVHRGPTRPSGIRRPMSVIRFRQERVARTVLPCAPSDFGVLTAIYRRLRQGFFNGLNEVLRGRLNTGGEARDEHPVAADNELLKVPFNLAGLGVFRLGKFGV